MSDIKAKKNKLLETLKSELSRGFIETEVKVLGHNFKLRTLNEDDEVWADSFLRTNSAAAMLSSRKAPRLAAAIASIDNVDANGLFEYPDTMSADDKKVLDENPVQKKYWLHAQMLMFLSEDANRDFINVLWDSYSKMEEQRAEAIKQIPN